MEDQETTRLPVEDTWHDFIRSIDGQVVEDILQNRNFNNADYFIPSLGIIAELKEIHTEFMSSESARKSFEAILDRLITEEPDWRPPLLGGNGEYPSWFSAEYLRLARAPVARILKKANIQIRETKAHFNVKSPTGILVCVNEGFTELAPSLVMLLVNDILKHSYSSIDCFIYTNLNARIMVPDSDEPKIIWCPFYSDRAEDSLVDAVNELGSKWFDYLQYTLKMNISSRIQSDNPSILRDSKAFR